MTDEILTRAESETQTFGNAEEKSERKKRKPWTGNDWVLVGMASLSVIFLAVFAYAPLYGLVLAFKDGDGWLNISQAISVADWCGLDNFVAFFEDPDFWNIILNTLGLNLLQLLINFPLPILFAVFTAELLSDHYKKFVQTVTFFPHFISWAVYGGIFLSLFALDTGLPALLQQWGLTEYKVDILGEAGDRFPRLGYGRTVAVSAYLSDPRDRIYHSLR